MGDKYCYAESFHSEGKETLNDADKAIRWLKILVMEVADKSNLDDDAVSPLFPILREFERQETIVVFNDPWAQSIHKKHEFMEFHQR